VIENRATLLTVADAARRLNGSRPTIYRRISEGSLPALRIGTGGPLRIDAVELECWLYGWEPPPGYEEATGTGAARSPLRGPDEVDAA
jgi:excisionase family DNA binding protein